MSTCESCRKLTFIAHASPDSLDFVANLHPSLDALRNSAGQGTCSLCIALLGSIRHRKFIDTSEELSQDPRNNIELSFSYFEIGDWIGVDGEEESEADDTVSHLVVKHPFGRDFFKILNPDALSRRRWATGEPVSASSRERQRSLTPCSAGQADESTGSNAALALAASWIEDCKKNHSTCQRVPVIGIETPKRLLNVSEATSPTGRIFLVTFDSAARTSHKIQYGTLSHRWDPNRRCMTTTQNQETHTNLGLAISELPKSFGEACITCNKLGVQYFWIDSLCILQDSDNDKFCEIPKMGDYYQNSEFNISASTEMTDGGIWKERDGRATRPLVVPITINLPSPHSRVIQVSLEIAPLLRGPKSHLDYRGWILQERIFPRRTLFFDPYWISFQCAEATASENCPAGMKIGISTSSLTQERNMGIDLHRDCSLAVMGGILRNAQEESIDASVTERHHRSLYKLWYRVIQEYTQRVLTFESDRLLAIAGLARILSRLLDDEYITGIWKGDLITGLQWTGGKSSTSGSPNYLSRSNPRRAPTWSWASIDLSPSTSWTQGRPIAGIHNDYSEDTPPDVSLATVINVQWTCSDASAFGDTTNARLVLQGRPLQGLLRMTIDFPDLAAGDPTMPDGDLEKVSEEQGYPPLGYRGGAYWYVYICGTTSGGERGWIVMDAFLDVASDYVEGKVQVFPLCQRWYFGFHAMFCLILKEVPGERAFERVGWARSIPRLMPKAKQRNILLV